MVAACRAAGVTRSAYYAWSATSVREPSARDREKTRLVAEIRRIHARSGGTYGVPRMTTELRRRGWRVNRKRVERLMRCHGIVGYRPRRRRSLAKPDAGAAPAPDLLGRLFDPDRLDVAWCGDVTLVPTDQGWPYLAAVIDLASRRLLGSATGERHDTDLAVRAVEAAVATRGQRRMAGTIFHSDRGSEDAATATVEACQRLGLTQSMSRTGSCLDNAAAESWFASLKVELVGRTRYRTRAEAQAGIFAWIAYYNATRLHSARQYLPPLEWEHRHARTEPLPLDRGRIAPVSGPAGGVQRIVRRTGAEMRREVST